MKTTTIQLRDLDDAQFRSLSRERVAAEAVRGLPVWRLDGPGAGRDVLVGDRSAVMAEVLAYYELAAFPPDWHLDPIELDQRSEVLAALARAVAAAPDGRLGNCATMTDFERFIKHYDVRTTNGGGGDSEQCQ